MIGSTFDEVYDELYYGCDIEMTWNSVKYMISSGICPTGEHLIYAYIVGESGVVDIYPKVTNQDRKENLDKFLNAKVFDNKSFLEIQDEVTIDEIY